MSSPRRLSPSQLRAQSRCRPRHAEPVAVEDLLERLEDVRRNGEARWMAKCPGHGDRTASLSVRVGDDGRILLHCFSGCSFGEIARALAVEPRQLFPPSSEPWRPARPRRDPEQAARDLFRRLGRLREAPAPERVRKELCLVRRLLLGGTAAFAELPPTFRADAFETFPLRLVFLAMAELVKQGTPRRRFSPLALAREVERVGGGVWRKDVFFWCRAAAGEARWEP